MKTIGILAFICVFISSLRADPQKVDVLVLGGGVGGLTASIYLARAGCETLVVEGSQPGGAITLSKSVQNYPGELDITGLDLIEKIRSQAEKNGVNFLQEEVCSVDFSSSPFVVTLAKVYNPSEQRQILAKSCIIATGAKARKLGVPGEEEYSYKGVYTCAICDGSLYKDKTVAVVGGGDAAVLDADYLSKIAKKVYLLVRKNTLKGVEKKRAEDLAKNPKVEIIYDVEVREIQGSKDSVEKLKLSYKSGKSAGLSVDAVFLAIGSLPNTQLFASKLSLDVNGYIKIKDNFETSIPGVFAVGDVVDPIFKQAISAAGDAAKAAIQAQMYLSSLKAAPVEQKVAKVLEVTSEQELKDLLKTSKVPVLLDFYATWCGPCRYLGGFMDSWAKELSGKAIICKVNVDKVPNIAAFYQIRSMPTFLQVDQSGKETVRKVGADEIIRYVNGLK